MGYAHNEPPAGMLAAARGRSSGARLIVLAVLSVLVLVSTASMLAAEERRVALIVGNSKYRNLSDRDLKNPVQDAADMQVALQRLNFEMLVGQDMPLEAFRQMASDFAKRVRNADIALLFYAGHGVQYDGQNYLLPTDIELKSQGDIISKSVALNKVLDDMAHAKTSIIFLDACRDSPQFRSVSRGMASSSPSTWEYLSGLARIPAAPGDRFVGYAAAPGAVALDGDRGKKNSPFTEALIRHIAKEDIDIGAMFTAVTGDVMRSTRNRQRPEQVSTLSKQLYLARLANHAAPAVVQEPPPSGDDDGGSSISLSSDAEFWLVIKDTNDPKNFEIYLQQFPKGRFVALAKRKLEQLKPAAKPVEARARVPAAEAPAVEGDIVSASGIGRITKIHPKDEAARSARDLARARAILAKSPSASAGMLPHMVGSSFEAAELLGHMARGITYEEVWTTHPANAKEVRFDLRAKVRLLANEADRKLGGSIEPVEAVAGQPLKLKISAKKEASIGVFAWQADGTVVRLYPETARKPVQLRGGETITLPRSGDSYPAIASANLPRERRNHEAMIVVTGSGPIPFDQLVPALITEAPQQAEPLDASDFLSRLAAIQDDGLELLVLPYEVRSER